jgi:hypothetical protein
LTLAAGARWKVIGIVAVLAASGLALTAVADAPTRTGWWWALIAAKAGLLLVASMVFWHVSWRMWPRRGALIDLDVPARVVTRPPARREPGCRSARRR